MNDVQYIVRRTKQCTAIQYIVRRTVYYTAIQYIVCRTKQCTAIQYIVRRTIQLTSIQCKGFNFKCVHICMYIYLHVYIYLLYLTIVCDVAKLALYQPRTNTLCKQTVTLLYNYDITIE